ncbi:efflux RND transporter periplasmic adaptor subunit [Halothiobacillus sp. DCM-1]|uniref:efflux RND transporter periplasmic adaptor subunit n=1 Tax=Halothiobacillus sp. DCM-1 TaxID=3112558 RepID=UPI00324C38C8
MMRLTPIPLFKHPLGRTAGLLLSAAAALMLTACGNSHPTSDASQPSGATHPQEKSPGKSPEKGAEKPGHGHNQGNRFASMMGGPLKVSVVTPEIATVPITMTAAGTLASPNAVTLTPQVSGTIESVHVRSGQQVTKGTLLFTLDDQPFRTALRSAEAKRVGDAAQLRYAEQQVKQLTPLVKKEYVTRQSFDQAVATANAAQAQLAQDDAAIETARINLGYTVIRAPIDGRLGEITLQPGNLVVANNTALTTLVSNRVLLVNFSLPQAVLEPLRQEWPGFGQQQPGSAQEKAPAITILDEHAIRQISQGVLSFVDNSISTTTGTIRLQGTIDNLQGTLWPGQFVTAQLTLGQISNAQLIPAAAVQLSDQGDYVLVAKQGKAEMVPVKPLRTEGMHAVLPADALPADAQVIYPLPSRIAPGSAIEIARPEPAEPRPTGEARTPEGAHPPVGHP